MVDSNPKYHNLKIYCEKLEKENATLREDIRRLLEAEAERLEYPVDVEVVDLRAKVEAYERMIKEAKELLKILTVL